MAIKKGNFTDAKDQIEEKNETPGTEENKSENDILLQTQETQPPVVDKKEKQVSNEELFAVIQEMKNSYAETKQELEKLKAEKEAGTPRAGSDWEIEKIAKAFQRSKDYESGMLKVFDERELDPTDILPEAVCFYRHANIHFIFDDVRYGLPCTTPYSRPFKFDQVQVEKRRTGKEESVSYLCEFKTRSRREAEWLRAHTEYNATFFEDIRNASNVDVNKIKFLQLTIVELKRLPMQELINRIGAEEANGFICADKRDLNTSLVQLADFLAERQMLIEREKLKQYARQMSETELFSGKR